MELLLREKDIKGLKKSETFMIIIETPWISMIIIVD